MARRSRPIARTRVTRPAAVTVRTETIGAYQGRQHGRPSSDKGQGMWRTVSANYHTPVTIDGRWSATVSDQ